MTDMPMIFRRPAGAVRLKVAPQLASWDKAGTASQLRLADFLAHVADVAGPMVAAASGRVAVEVTVGLPGHLQLTDGGRDLDNYLFPVAQQLGAQRVAAMFGRKTRWSLWLAEGPAELEAAQAPPLFSARMTGSYERTAWKQALHYRLQDAGVTAVGPGPAGAGDRCGDRPWNLNAAQGEHVVRDGRGGLPELPLPAGGRCPCLPLIYEQAPAGGSSPPPWQTARHCHATSGRGLTPLERT